MATRGHYAKGVEKREQILDAVLEVIAREGYAAASIKQLADQVGLSQNGLLHYFGSKEALLLQALARRDALTEERAALESGVPEGASAPALREVLRDVVRHNVETAGLVELFTRVVAESTDPRHPGHEQLRLRYAEHRSTATAAIERLQVRGEVRRDVPAAHLSALLFATIDGIQTQWLFDRDLDMVAALNTFLDLLTPPIAARSTT